jgi:hypothetical protein
MNEENAGELEAFAAAQHLPASLRSFASSTAGPTSEPAPDTVSFSLTQVALENTVAAIRVSAAKMLTVEVACSSIRVSLEHGDLFTTAVADLVEPSNVPNGQRIAFRLQHDVLAKLLGVAPITLGGADEAAGVTRAKIQESDNTLVCIDFRAKDRVLEYRVKRPVERLARRWRDADVPGWVLRIAADPVHAKESLPWAMVGSDADAGSTLQPKLLSQALLFAEALRSRDTKAHTSVIKVAEGWTWGGSPRGVTAFYAPGLSDVQLRIKAMNAVPLARLLRRMRDGYTHLRQHSGHCVFDDGRMACGVITTKLFFASLENVRSVFTEKLSSESEVSREVLLTEIKPWFADAELYLAMRRTNERGELILSTAEDKKVRGASHTVELYNSVFADKLDEGELIDVGWLRGEDLAQVLSLLKADRVRIRLQPEVLILTGDGPEGEYVAHAAFHLVAGNQKAWIKSEAGLQWLKRSSGVAEVGSGVADSAPPKAGAPTSVD